MRIYIQVLALLCGTAFLLMASGLHGLLLPLRGGLEGFSVASLGMLGTTWAGGFVAGCIFAPRLVRRVGHVRAFGCFAASAAIIALLSGIYIDAISWIILRTFTGFSMAGAFMVIESWLNERATNESRGKIFGLYMMVNYGATMSGQMMVANGDIRSDHLFMITGILFCLALIPTAMSTAVSPKPLTEVQLDLKALYRNSPAAFVGCILIGIANGAWGTLGAVFGAKSGISTTEIALMVSVTIAAGALMQIPVGRISDLIDRRYVLAGVASLAAFVGLMAFIIGPSNGKVIIIMTGCYGALAYALYPVAVAHANDHASAESFVKVSSGLLLLYGFGTMLGPLLAAAAMDIFWPSGLFAITALSHISITAYALFRSRKRASVPKAEKEQFKSMPSVKSATPEAMNLDPRAEAEG
ncbi:MULTISPECIES: MFS transporter [Brucella]|uniref:MFS transporter n=1 Tax=Brucella pseudogrignonensis TaxID=419475 RepID=A0A1A9FNB1_9HYPH|nr:MULTISPECIES: MFS transporter [Brucella]EMG53682.1 major facilitator superfamily transporter [Ochrobactrum sp. CDB2]MBK0023398.1 MFS transporter [Ochrobactrum sp. S45]MBK0045232.1 MFS transporter [Ochrobactrum sp. S46]MQP42298.1 MFS transporter [Ochrobactrum sp. MYb237]ANG96587.1 MFS transporter [Brucella pseudogrignonensis]